MKKKFYFSEDAARRTAAAVKRVENSPLMEHRGSRRVVASSGPGFAGLVWVTGLLFYDADLWPDLEPTGSQIKIIDNYNADADGEKCLKITWNKDRQVSVTYENGPRPVPFPLNEEWYLVETAPIEIHMPFLLFLCQNP